MKIPRLFSKAYTQKRLDTKVLKHVYQKADLSYLKKRFKKGDDDKFRFDTDGIDRKASKRLKILAKTIVRNRSGLKRGKLILVAAIVVGAVLFSFLLKDRLVERGAEAALSAAFGAPVEMDGGRLSILRGTFSFEALRVGDARDESRNLFELGSSTAAIYWPALAWRRVLIPELSGTGLNFGTPASPDAGQDGAGDAVETSEDAGGDGAGSGFSLAPASFDAASIVAEQASRFAIYGAVESEREALEAKKAQWTREINSLESQVAGLQSTFDGLPSPSDLTDLTSLQSNLAAARTLVSDATSVQGQIQDLNRTIQAEGQYVVEGLDRFSNAYDADLGLLQSALPSGGFDAGSALGGFVESYLREKIGPAYDWILRGLALVKGGDEAEGTAAARGNRRSGTVVPFPTEQFPRFSIGRIALSGEGGAVEILNVSSDPDLVGDPWIASGTWTWGDTPVSLGVVVDLRSTSDEFWSVEVSASGAPVTLEDGLSGVGLAALSGTMDVQAAMAVDKSEAGVLDIDLALVDMAATPQDDGLTAAVVADSLAAASGLEIVAQAQIRANEAEVWTVTSNAGDLVAARADELGRQALADAQAALEAEYNKVAEKYLADNPLIPADIAAYTGDLSALGSQAGGIQDGASGLQSAFGDKIEDLGGSAAGAVQDAVQDATSKIKLPGF